LDLLESSMDLYASVTLFCLLFALNRNASDTGREQAKCVIRNEKKDSMIMYHFSVLPWLDKFCFINDECVFLFQHAWTCLVFLELVSSQNDVHSLSFYVCIHVNIFLYL
jgi:hypothetical protein